MDTPSQPCTHSGEMLSVALGGMCSLCLLRFGLKPRVSFPDELWPGEDGKPAVFGNYELVERIARGGMGVVYKARHLSLNRVVALKVLAEGKLASDAEVHRFQAEPVAVAGLDHPNIVPLYEAGMYEGRHYFTMRLMEGGSLAAQVPDFYGRSRKVARLVETIARAVHYGHKQGVLHRDLKPANLLLDAAGVPHVADFGVAQALNTEGTGSLTEPVGGTPGYMALEQAEPRGQPLTVAADVYGLGVILYELLTGRLPYEAERREQLLTLQREARPPAPRELEPRISRELEAICLKCLEKEPARRYGSAEELADELERYLEDEPIVARPVGRLGRAWLWCRRHPLGAGLLATLIWSLSVVAVGAVRIASAQEAYLRGTAQRDNARAARQIAGAVLFELLRYSQAMERAAARPELAAWLHARDRAALEAFCRDHFTYHDNPGGQSKSSGKGSLFVRCFLQDQAGLTLAHWPKPENPFIDKNFRWRDYFRGVERLAKARQADVKERQPAVYVSRAFVATGGGEYSFVLSAPVYATDGAWIGLLGATVASDSTLGSLQLNDDDKDHTATLVALTDRERPEDTLPGRDTYAVLVHEDLGRGKQVTLKSHTARQLEMALPEPVAHGEEQLLLSPSGSKELTGYRDPVSDDPGPWLAAVAPVGHTGFAVIVQTREKAVFASNTLLARGIALWSLPFAIGTGLVWLVVWWLRFRSSGQRTG